MKFTDEEGKEWEWRGEYRTVKHGDYWLGLGKCLSGPAGRATRAPIELRAIIHPVPKVHEFGGVRFEEVEEARLPREGDWVLGANGKFAFWFYPGRFFAGGKHVILRPLQGEEEGKKCHAQANGQGSYYCSLINRHGGQHQWSSKI